MRKLYLNVLLLCTAFVWAQEPDVNKIDSVQIPFNEQMDHVFEHLDLSAVTTGLLLNRSFPTIDVTRYHGNAGHDTLKRWENFCAIYS